MAKKTTYKEGKWRCTHVDLASDDPCNHENPGPALMCEKCHKHRPKNVQFYLPKNAKTVSDQQSLEDAKAGANWRCMNCNYDNKATNFHCEHCMTIRDEAEEKWVNLGGDLATKKYAAGQVPTSSAPATPTIEKQTKERKKLKPYLLYLAAGIGAFILIWFIYAQFFKVSALEVEVSGFSWEREVVIEQIQTVTEEGWSMPVGGRQLRRETRKSGTEEVYDHSEWESEPVYENVQVGTEQVECGTIDKGNGYFETEYCDEPIYEEQQVGTREVERKIYRTEDVYDYWYTYEIDRWIENRSPESSGNDQKTYWPNYQLKTKERVGKKSESYTVYLTPLTESKFSSLTYDLNESDWLKLNIGDKRIAMVKKSGTVTALKNLE